MVDFLFNLAMESLEIFGVFFYGISACTEGLCHPIRGIRYFKSSMMHQLCRSPAEAYVLPESPSSSADGLWHATPNHSGFLLNLDTKRTCGWARPFWAWLRSAALGLYAQNSFSKMQGGRLRFRCHVSSLSRFKIDAAFLKIPHAVRVLCLPITMHSG